MMSGGETPTGSGGKGRGGTPGRGAAMGAKPGELIHFLRSRETWKSNKSSDLIYNAIEEMLKDYICLYNNLGD